jgi:hypothetical protein
MPGLVPGIHALLCNKLKASMAETGPAMTNLKSVRVERLYNPLNQL